MTVGEALTEARCQAGLSVEELSERTKIRGTVIRSIEQDDYEACGGDLYVRGYVRAIAGAIGIDAQPLVREYDLSRSGGANQRTSGSTGSRAGVRPDVTSPETAQTSLDLPAVPEAPPAQRVPVPPVDLNVTRYDMPAVSADPAPTSYDLPRVPEVDRTAELQAAEFAATEYPTAEFPGLMPLPPTLPPAPVPPRAVPPGAAETRYDLTAVPEDLSPAASEDLMAAGYDLGPAEAPADANAGTQLLPPIGFGQAPPPAATNWPGPGPAGPVPAGPVPAGPVPAGPVPAGPVPAGPVPAGAVRKNRRALFVVSAAAIVVVVGALGYSLVSRGGSTAAGASSSTNASAAAKASALAAAQAKASPSARAQHATSLPVASVMAFGPHGTADGDNPGNAADAIAAGPSRPWVTQWYDTSKFGMLKHGTGLLLDLGGKATVTTVRLDLSQYQGADLQLRVGNAEALPDLHVAATAKNVGGALKLTLHHQAAARYLLIWFTRLPPNGSGHYQESVSHVAVTGVPLT